MEGNLWVGHGMKSAVHCLGLAFGLLVGLLPAARAEPDMPWQSPDAVVDAFVELALHSDYSLRQTPLRKWTGPLRYRIVHGVGDEGIHARLVETHLDHLARITGLSIAPAASPAAANFLIVLTSDERMEADTQAFIGTTDDAHRERVFRERMCLASFRADRQGAIQRAVAVIPVDRARGRGDLIGCIAEELTHLMGLANDTEKPFPTIFHHGTVRSFLTGLDTVVLEMLYDPRLQPGLREPALRPLLLKIAVEKQRAGILEDADRRAGTEGLSTLAP